MYSHLTRDHRIMIYTVKLKGLNQTQIAKTVGCSQPTVSRELKRNRGKRGYRFKQASLFAQKRRSQASSRSSLSKEKITYISQKIVQKWSPEQIAQRMKQDEGKGVSHETIYSFLKKDKEKGGELYKHLRCQRKKRKRYAKTSKTRGILKDRVSIDQRPQEASLDKKFGHLEADLMIDKNHKKAFLTIVDKKTRLAFIKLVSGKKSDEVCSTLITLLTPYKKILKTLTLDNGKEWGRFKMIEKKLGLKVYFADPYCAWQRGLNEQTNGLIRQYFPKKTDFRAVSSKEVDKVMKELNSRPRKCLGFETPLEAFKTLTSRKFYALQP